MKREEIKSYKDACKVIGRKPRTYKDKHLNLYEQLSTITAALNFKRTTPRLVLGRLITNFKTLSKWKMK